MNKRQRTRNQRYETREFNTPITLFTKEEADDGGYSGVTFLLYVLQKSMALIYKPSSKDIEMLGTRLSETSLTIVMPQINGISVDTAMMLKLHDPRMGQGYFDIDEIIPDIQNGRFMKLLVKRTTQSKRQFKEVLDV